MSALRRGGVKDRPPPEAVEREQIFAALTSKGSRRAASQSVFGRAAGTVCVWTVAADDLVVGTMGVSSVGDAIHFVELYYIGWFSLARVTTTAKTQS